MAKTGNGGRMRGSAEANPLRAGVVTDLADYLCQAKRLEFRYTCTDTNFPYEDVSRLSFASASAYLKPRIGPVQ